LEGLGRPRGGGRPAVSDPHDDSPHGGGRGDDQGGPDVGLDPLPEEKPGEPAGDGGHDDHRGEATRERAGHQPGELAPKVGQQRGERTQMHDGVEGQSLIRPAEDERNQDQVPGRRDGEELGQALDQAQNDALGVAHPTMSSPPSTPMTLPVIQYVSGWARTTMARATSAGVVMRPWGLRRRASAAIDSYPGIFWAAGGAVTPARMALAVMPWGGGAAASGRTCDARGALAADTGP